MYRAQGILIGDLRCDQCARLIMVHSPGTRLPRMIEHTLITASHAYLRSLGA